MKDSSTLPMRPPLMYFTCIVASDTMVPMPMRWRRPSAGIRHAVDALLVRQHAPVFGIDGQALAAARDEVERPLPFFPASGARYDQALAHFVVQRLRSESRRPAPPSPGAAPARRTACWAPGAPRCGAPPPPACAPAASSSSRLLVGTSVTRETRPGAWPLRPARCSRRAMPLALPICSTRSTGRKSTPRSRLAVQITAFSSPFFRPSLDPFAHLAVERAVVQRDHAGPVGPRLQDVLVPDLRLRAGVGEHQRGVVLLDLVDHRLQHLRCPGGRPTESATRWSGISESTTISLRRSPSTSTPVSCAQQHLRAPGRGCPSSPTAPHTTSSGRQRRRRASASCTCTPRLLPISSCHSSMMIMSSARTARAPAAWLSSSDRLSGVVTSVDGRLRVWRARSAEPVSPVRAPMRPARAPARPRSPPARAGCRPPAPASA